MDSLKYEKSYIVKSSDVDSTKKMRITGIMNVLQDLAVMGAEILGFGKDKVLDKGYLWVFSKLEIKIFRLPDYLEEIELITYPNQTMHFIYPRTFEFKDKDGNILIKATSLWCLIDKETRKLLSPKETGVNPISQIKVDKISPINVFPTELKEKRRVRYSDLDINNHLNNIRYLEYILDLFDSNFICEKDIKKINMVFHQEIKENEIVYINASPNNSYFYFSINEDKKVFECNIE